MSEYATPDQRTEMPTDRRIGQLRKEGQVHLSQEVVQVTSLLTGFMILQLSWSWFVGDLESIYRKAFHLIAQREPLTQKDLYDGFLGVLYHMAPPVLMLLVAVASVSSLVVMLQTKWNIKEKKIHVRLELLNPIKGLQRVFSIHGVMNTLKAIVKLAIILPIAYVALKSFAPEMIKLIHLSVDDILKYTGVSMATLFWRVMYVLIALAVFDYFWSYFQWLKQAKMTKDEVKMEHKAVEGDEETKRRIKQKGWQRIVQRIQKSVPTADVVVTNPTHFAVALKYDRANMRAPQVVAKGKDYMAFRIREIAAQSGVPVLERKPLARALYASCEIGAEIPYDLYRAVAEVLAYVYRLRGGRKAAAANVAR